MQEQLLMETGKGKARMDVRVGGFICLIAGSSYLVVSVWVCVNICVWVIWYVNAQLFEVTCSILLLYFWLDYNVLVFHFGFSMHVWLILTHVGVICWAWWSTRMPSCKGEGRTASWFGPLWAHFSILPMEMCSRHGTSAIPVLFSSNPCKS